jgi:high affinity Mn2+ porin
MLRLSHAAALASLAFASPSTAADGPVFPQDASLHFQSTLLPQYALRFRSPYQGPNSLTGDQGRETWTTTVFLGFKTWEGGEFFINPELDQGFGLSRTTGLGGFSNGEAQKGGQTWPHPHLHRVFLRQTFGLGGPQETVEDAANQTAGKRDISRITVTAGKFSVGDMFDDNTYSHDPRTTFMNWANWASGAFDYPADQFGFTWGAAAELNQKSWAFRAGYFMLPKEANSNVFDDHVPARGGWVAELELRHTIAGRAGKVKLLGFLNEANSGSYREALADPGLDLAVTRRTRPKYGLGVNIEQAITPDLGVFSRASWNNGKTEIMSFTDIDASLSVGAVLKGTRWGRPNDSIGVAGAINGLSRDHRDFLAAGGIGILVGDGRLTYANERIFETYYAFSLWGPTTLSFDYQFIANPAYNADRGPVSILSARLHTEF